MITNIISDYTRIDIDKQILVCINVVNYRPCRICYSGWFVNYLNATKQIDTIGIISYWCRCYTQFVIVNIKISEHYVVLFSFFFFFLREFRYASSNSGKIFDTITVVFEIIFTQTTSHPSQLILFWCNWRHLRRLETYFLNHPHEWGNYNRKNCNHLYLS